MANVRVGDIVNCKGGGVIYNVLKPPLKWKNPEWDGWGWHLAPIVRVETDSLGIDHLWVFNADATGLHVKPIEYIHGGYRIYRWFDKELNQGEVNEFCREREGCPYDVLIYFLTAVQQLLLPNHTIPRLLDNGYSCWEVTEIFCDVFGRPWCYSHDVKTRYPVLTDFLRDAGKPIVEGIS